jgi:hypothetical protein
MWELQKLSDRILSCTGHWAGDRGSVVEASPSVVNVKADGEVMRWGSLAADTLCRRN